MLLNITRWHFLFLFYSCYTARRRGAASVIKNTFISWYRPYSVFTIWSSGVSMRSSYIIKFSLSVWLCVCEYVSMFELCGGWSIDGRSAHSRRRTWDYHTAHNIISLKSVLNTKEMVVVFFGYAWICTPQGLYPIRST